MGGLGGYVRSIILDAFQGTLAPFYALLLRHYSKRLNE
jgi:hypothetical protein